MPTDIQLLIDTYGGLNSYDDLLFLMQVTVGFNQLLCLGKLCVSDDPALWDCHKSMICFDVKSTPTHLQLLLPGHKADKFFCSSMLIVLNDNDPLSPHPWILKYLKHLDALYGWKPDLWLHEDGSYPSHF